MTVQHNRPRNRNRVALNAILYLKLQKLYK